MHRLIKEVSLSMGGVVVDRQRSCDKCGKLFPMNGDDKFLRMLRSLSYKSGNLNMCDACDPDVPNADEMRKSVVDERARKAAKYERELREKEAYISSLNMTSVTWCIKLNPKVTSDRTQRYIDYLLDELDQYADKYDGIKDCNYSYSRKYDIYKFTRKFSTLKIDAAVKALREHKNRSYDVQDVIVQRT